MAASVNVYQKFDVTIDGVKYEGGSLTTAQTVALVSDVIYDRTFSVAASTLTELMQVGATTTDDIGDFDFLMVVSDKTGQLQLVTDESGANPLGLVVPLVANIPFILGSDDSMNGTIANINTWETTWVADVIDRLEFYHTNTGQTAKVRVFAVT